MASQEEDKGLEMRKKRLSKLTEEMEEILPPTELIPSDNSETPPELPPSRKGILKVKCKCGSIVNLSEDIIEHGLSWTMLIGNDHFMKLMCQSCDSELTMFIEEILDEDELLQESNKE
jgi:hypothetical protein